MSIQNERKFFHAAAWIALLLVLGMYLLLDVYYAVSLNLLILGGVAASGSFVVLALHLVQPRRYHLFLLALVLAGVVTVRSIDWNARKPFMRTLARIAPGMTVAQVDQTMAGYTRLPALPYTLSQSQQVVFRYTNEGWGDSDAGVITFHNGAVTDVTYLHD